MEPITTNILRAGYDRREFSYGNPGAAKKVVLIGSCRIVPLLNCLRVYNALNGNPFELLCFNPVEMWVGPGHHVSDGVNHILEGYRFGATDFLVCEHLQYCGVLNTVRSSEENVFDSLGCSPAMEIRLPNWNDMHIFDAETACHSPTYAALGHNERVAEIRKNTAVHKYRFLSHCAGSSFPELVEWVEANWLTTRMGWTSSHPSHPLLWQMFRGVFRLMGLQMTSTLLAHPLCATDVYAPTGFALTSVDYEANNWKY